MKRLHRFAAFALLILLVGCASLGLEPAKSFDDRLAYAYGTHTAVLTAARSSVELHALSSADATDVLKLADESRLLLDAARTAAQAGDATTGNAKLVLATAILTQLRDYLNARAKP